VRRDKAAAIACLRDGAGFRCGPNAGHRCGAPGRVDAIFIGTSIRGYSAYEEAHTLIDHARGIRRRTALASGALALSPLAFAQPG